MKSKLFDVLSDLEGLCTELEDINNLLTIFDGNINDAFCPLRRGESWGVEYLSGQWSMHQSTLNVIRLRLFAILEEMQSGVYRGYDAIRSAKEEQA